MLFHERLEAIMRLQQWSQTDVAKRLGITQASVSHWVRGRSEPTITRAAELAKILRLPLDYLTADDRDEVSVGGIELAQDVFKAVQDMGLTEAYMWIMVRR